MRIKVIMDSGVEYILNEEIEDFIAITRGIKGDLVNELIEIKKRLFINPTHIASVEVIE